MTPFFNSPLGREANSFPNLVAYVARMMRQFYPDHPWTVATPDVATGGGSLPRLSVAAMAK